MSDRKSRRLPKRRVVVIEEEETAISSIEIEGEQFKGLESLVIVPESKYAEDTINTKQQDE